MHYPSDAAGRDPAAIQAAAQRALLAHLAAPSRPARFRLPAPEAADGFTAPPETVFVNAVLAGIAPTVLPAVFGGALSLRETLGALVELATGAALTEER